MDHTKPERVKVTIDLPCGLCPFVNKFGKCEPEFYEANGFDCRNVPVYINTGRRVNDENI